ncbi:sensor histidine kinase [Streptomyces pathocidini]|uniref:histidine kinase n=2 Tax=Streptomyces pathocidini TaxID=1650571 RepID=A0ABW7UNN2_9ACTN
MKETVHEMTKPTRGTAPGPGESWTESRIAGMAWQGLRGDLFEDIWAFRPLPPLRAERFARRPRLERLGARWLPHAVVVAFALFVTLADASSRESYPSNGLEDLIALILALVQTVPLLLTLTRPVGAWWLSLGGITFNAAFWPHGPGPGIAAHVGVMVLVTLRSRPRLAAEMWAISLVVVALAEAFFGPDPYGGSAVLPYAVLTAFFLAIAVAVRGWSLARGEVAEQETLVADVLGQHTLLEERARIARELHDVVAHHMSVIAIQAEAAPYRVTDPPEELARSFATIRESAVEALAELRRVLGVLRFESPDGGPDAPQPDLSRLDELVDGVRAVGLSVEIARTGAERALPQGVELSAFRIIQEALSNALRHAPGSQVRVEVSYVLTGLGLRVVNTAPTADVMPSPGMGHGVMGMRERAAMLGGELTAGPTGGGGYEVAAFLPVEQPAEQEQPASTVSFANASTVSFTKGRPAVEERPAAQERPE